MKLAARAAFVVVSAFALLAPPVVAESTTPIDWPGYMHDPTHSSYQPAATAITTSNVASLVVKWNWKPAAPTKTGQPSPYLFATPAVYDGRVYLGANTGVFTALDETTGAVLWNRFLGFMPTLTCYKRGITSSAAVGVDPLLGEPIVYVGGGNGFLYALKASDGTTVWRSRVVNTGVSLGQNAGYIWGSPTVVNGHVYIGISSDCDYPLIRGGVREFDASTGARLATYWTVPVGSVGGSVWSSTASDLAGDSVWVTTGNEGGGTSKEGASNSIVHLAGDGLAKLDRWTIPAAERIVDSDFGGSPTLFEATLSGTPTPMVGACNKNGVYYAWRQGSLASGPVWRRRLGPGEAGGAMCIAGAVWDGERLFAAGTNATVGGTSYPGSIRQLDPATGVPVWTRGLAAGPVLGSPTLNGSGVLAVASYNETTQSANRLYLLDASTGAILREIASNGSVFAQPVLADGYVFLASRNGGLTAYAPGP